jgi:hypothetical protein
MEFRIDFIDGEAVHGRHRFGHEYLPDEIRAAKEFLNDFFRHAPPELRQLAGGADVARLVDGSYLIIEFNFGGSSGTLMPHFFIVESNLYISALQGKPTPLIQSFEATFKQGTGAQNTYLKSLTRERFVWEKKNLSDLSAVEAGQWFRDKHLQNWQKNPSRDHARTTLNNIRELFEGLGVEDRETFDRLIAGAQSYLSIAAKQNIK